MLKPGSVGSDGRAGIGGIGIANESESEGSPGNDTLNPGSDGNVGIAGIGGIGIASENESVGNAQLLMRLVLDRCPSSAR